MPIFRAAAQMYTLRNVASRDFAGACRRLAEVGYQGAELTDMRGQLSAAALKTLGLECGLTWLSVHVDLQEMESNLSAIIDFYLAAGISTLVCPWISPQRRNTLEDWHNISKSLSDISERLQQAGMTLAYHHHDFEFLKIAVPDAPSTTTVTPGSISQRPADAATCGMDIILQATDLANVKIELDTYWLYYVGLNPADYIHHLANRLALLHCKDMGMGENREFSTLGSGRLNWTQILSEAKFAGLEWLIVEQDDCYGHDPFACLARSVDYLRRLNMV